jgi:transposase
MARRKLVRAALWKRIEPLLPPFTPSPKGGRPRVDDERALNGILYVLESGIPWEELPQELGFGSGMTCWRRLRDWQAAGVWDRLHRVLLAELNRAGQIDWSRASLDAASVASPRGARSRGPTRRTAASSAANATSS